MKDVEVLSTMMQLYSPVYTRPLTWIPIWIKVTWVGTGLKVDTVLVMSPVCSDLADLVLRFATLLNFYSAVLDQQPANPGTFIRCVCLSTAPFYFYI